MEDMTRFKIQGYESSILTAVSTVFSKDSNSWCKVHKTGKANFYILTELKP